MPVVYVFGEIYVLDDAGGGAIITLVGAIVHVPTVTVIAVTEPDTTVAVACGAMVHEPPENDTAGAVVYHAPAEVTVTTTDEVQREAVAVAVDVTPPDEILYRKCVLVLSIAPQEIYG